MMRASARRAALALACCLAACWAPAVAHADTRLVKGTQLALTVTTDEDSVIETDPSLSGAVRVMAESVDCLDMPGTGGGAVVISNASCGSSSGRLQVMVPPGFPVAVTIAGSGNMRMGDHLGPVKATITSDGDLSLRHASLLQLAIRGSGDATLEAVDGPADIQVDGSGSVKLQRLNGPLQFVQHGSGDLLVSRIDSPAVKIELTGSGDVVLGPGHIVALQARTDGSGDVSAATNIDSADLQASGGGDITLPHVSGTVRKAASDSSTIRINSAGGIGSAALQRLSSLSLADSDDGAEIVRDGQGMNRVSHLLAGMVVLGLLIAVWRTVLRHGGLARLRNHMPRGASPAAPTHPGVVALCDLIANLERRLARVETHVTSREFDLNRKFREIDARSGEMH